MHSQVRCETIVSHDISSEMLGNENQKSQNRSINIKDSVASSHIGSILAHHILRKGGAQMTRHTIRTPLISGKAFTSTLREIRDDLTSTLWRVSLEQREARPVSKSKVFDSKNDTPVEDQSI